MTREEAVKIVGEEWVQAVEQENCDYSCPGVWTASVLFNGGYYVSFPNGKEYRGIKAVYDEPDGIGEVEDLSCLDWKICSYELLD